MKQNSDTITESTYTAFFNLWTSSRYLYEYNNLKTKSQHISNGFSESAKQSYWTTSSSEKGCMGTLLSSNNSSQEQFFCK